ncbi:MAG: PQQ-like beta-propeller repeat protein [Planctomycetaceae bacterium]|nr:PQQ-like beta-propeller repeat protein [Planctomycetaceae bacterium]
MSSIENTSVLNTSPVPGVKQLYYLSLATAAVSGLFCVVFIVLLLVNYLAPHYHIQNHQDIPLLSIMGTPAISNSTSYRQPASDAFNALPTDSYTFNVFKHQLSEDRGNENLHETIRQFDRQLRYRFLMRREVIAKITPFLLFSAVVFFASVRLASILNRKIPVPAELSPARIRQNEQKQFSLGVLSLTVCSAVLIGFAIGVMFIPPSHFEKVLAAKIQEEEAQKQITQQQAATQTPVIPTLEIKPAETLSTETKTDEKPFDKEAFLAEAKENWAAFRSFDGSGTVRSKDGGNRPPLEWDSTADKNIVWKTEIALPGKSSPVVWKTEKGTRIFLTGADEEKRQIYCFDGENGTQLWAVDVPPLPESSGKVSVSEDTGFAAPTMVTNGQAAAAMFANGDVVAVDFDGKILWHKPLGIPDSSYGFSASPALYYDKIIVQYDFGKSSEEKSKLYCFDLKTGSTIWETPREFGNSWSSPVVCTVAGKEQVITCAEPFVVSYNPETGKEIWRAKCLSGDIGPSPVFYGNNVFVTNQSPQTSAIDASGEGDVTATNILWRGNNALSDTASPIAAERHLYTFDSHGYLTAYDPTKINEKNRRAAFWELEIGGGEAAFYSSPVLVGERLYMFDMTEDNPRSFVIDLSKAEIDDNGELTEKAREEMIAATNPMSEPCVASPAIVGSRIYIRGSNTLFCIGE